jgi:glycosyltransferase involved in cell wall biosynthesis
MCSDENILPGISAVLAVDSRLVGDIDDRAVLDLAAVLDGLVADNFEIILVGVGSTQAIVNLVSDLAARRPGLRLRGVEHACPDHASALAAGFDSAGYDLIFETTSDGQFDFHELNHLLESIEHGADLAIGYRSRRADSLVRRFYGWGWNLLVNVLFGKTGRDVDCAFKLFRRTVWERTSPQSRGAGFNAELLIRARRHGFVVDEVPVRHRRPRHSGQWSVVRGRGPSVPTLAAAGPHAELTTDH